MHSRRYTAFISYRHADNTQEGRRWAEWLHRALEQYMVPPDLIGTPNLREEPIRDTLYPIFRDQDELPANADLATGIREALERSDYLIVLCSPRSAVSPWVRNEVKEFKQLGRSDRILAIIISGEPNADDPAKARDGIFRDEECFCEELRFGAVRKDGSLDWAARTEPTAADLRPVGTRAEGFVTAEAYREHLTFNSSLPPDMITSRTEAYRLQLDRGLLQIVAGLLGVELGRLVNRDAAYRTALAEAEAARQRKNAERERQLAEDAGRAKDEALESAARMRKAIAVTVTFLLIAVGAALFGLWKESIAEKAESDLRASFVLFKQDEGKAEDERQQRVKAAEIVSKYGYNPSPVQKTGNWLLDELSLNPVNATPADLKAHFDRYSGRTEPEYIFLSAMTAYHLGARHYEEKELVEAAQQLKLGGRLLLEAAGREKDNKIIERWREEGLRMLYRSALVYGEAKDYLNAITTVDETISGISDYAQLFSDPKDALFEDHLKRGFYLAGRAKFKLLQAIATGDDPMHALEGVTRELDEASKFDITVIRESPPAQRDVRTSLNPRLKLAVTARDIKSYKLANRLFVDALAFAEQAKEAEAAGGVESDEVSLRHLKRQRHIRFAMAQCFIAQNDATKAVEQLVEASQLSEQINTATSQSPKDNVAMLIDINWGIETSCAIARDIIKDKRPNADSANKLLDVLLLPLRQGKSIKQRCGDMLNADDKGTERDSRYFQALRLSYVLSETGETLIALRNWCEKPPSAGDVQQPLNATKDFVKTILENAIQAKELALNVVFSISVKTGNLEVLQERFRHLANNNEWLGIWKSSITSVKIDYWSKAIACYRRLREVAAERFREKGGDEWIAWSMMGEANCWRNIAQLDTPASINALADSTYDGTLREVLQLSRERQWQKSLSLMRDSVTYQPATGSVWRSANLAWTLRDYLLRQGPTMPLAEKLAIAKEARDLRRDLLLDWLKEPSKPVDPYLGSSRDLFDEFTRDSKTYTELLVSSDPVLVTQVAEEQKRLTKEYERANSRPQVPSNAEK